MTNISPEAKKIIDRIAAHSWRREKVSRATVERAITAHLNELGLPSQPFRWLATAQEGYEAASAAAWSAAWSAAESAAWSAARSAAWSAAESAAWSAASAAAWSAAWSAAEANALGAFDHPTQAKLAAIWLPMVDAFNAGLWIYWITPTEVICVEQPSLHIVDNRLHREDGPAVEWPAGEAYYFWRGTQVPAHWIMDRSNLDPAEVVRAANVEQRAAGAAIVGWPRMLSVLNARVVNDGGNDDIGQLIELTLPGLPEPGRFLKAVCPRNGLIVEGIPRISDIDGRPIETALAAQAWRIGDPQSEYEHPTKRT